MLVGDAELDEGSNHEALELAAALGLDALTVVVVDNRSSSYAVPGRIAGPARHRGLGRSRPSTAVTSDALEHALQPPVATAYRTPSSPPSLEEELAA